MSWDEEKIAKLKEMWGKGNTASQIAEIIGGISRNAVIGKAHRLNLSAKIKTRAKSSNQNLRSNNDSFKIQTGRNSGREPAAGAWISTCVGEAPSFVDLHLLPSPGALSLDMHSTCIRALGGALYRRAYTITLYN